jgi:hypothetical protein
MVIPAFVAADGTDILISECATNLTVMHILSGINDRIRQLFDSVLWQIDQVKCQSLSGLTSDARKGCKFFN